MNPPLLAAFPKRPVELRKPRAVSWSMLALGAMCAGLLVADLVYIVPQMVADASLRSAPQARDADLSGRGTCKTRLFITECEYDLAYRSADGTRRASHQHLVTLLAKVDTALPLEVRYDPADPQRISSTWGRELLVNRVFAQLVTVGFCALMLLGTGWMQRDTLRERRKLARIERAPQPVAATPLGVHRLEGSVRIDFEWTDPRTGERRHDATELEAGTEPLWLDAQRAQALALAGPNGRAHLLDSRLSGVALRTDERAALAQARRETALGAQPA
jgi:hypothetical protein